MRPEIASILEGLPAVKIEQIGYLWQIRVANLAGAREDGISLANDLKAQYHAMQARQAYKVSTVHVIEPVPEKAPDPETIPPALADLIRENEAYGEAQARLWALYVSLQNKLMLGIASETDARLHTRLHGHLAWISKGAAEVVR